MMEAQGEQAESQPAPTAGPPAPRKKPFTYSTVALAVIATLAIAALGGMRQLDGALAARHLPGAVGIGVLGFPTLFSGNRTETVQAAVAAWYDAAPDDRFASGVVLAQRVLYLDFIFIGLYGLGLALLRLRLSRSSSPVAARFAGVRNTLLTCTFVALLCLVAFDVAEGVVTLSVVDAEWDRCRGPVCSGDGGGASPAAITVMAALTTAKWLAAGLVLVPLGVVLSAHAVPRLKNRLPEEETAFRRMRILLAVLVGLALVLSLGISGEQTAEVIRAWDWGHVCFAAATATVLAATTWSAVRIMIARVDVASPETGRAPDLWFVAVGCVLAVAGGLLTTADGWSGAIAVPGAMLLGIGLLSVLITGLPPYEAVEDSGDAAVLNSEEAQAARQRLGRLWERSLAAAVLVVLTVVAIRAATFDLLGRPEPFESAERWIRPVLFAVACFAGALAFLLYRGRLLPRFDAGAVASGLVLVAGAIVLASSPLRIGSEVGAVAVIAWFFAWLTGALAVGTWVGAALGRAFQQPALLSSLGLRRFPTLSFVVLWFGLASLIPWVDPGGYHDVRVISAPATETEAEEPQGSGVTLDDAWKRWTERNLSASTSANGDRSAVPLVLVAASGGGIRAAAWTSLALDCIFQRLPVDASGGPYCRAEDTSGTDAESAGDRLFAASGTSGGSLGLVEYDALLRNQAAGAERSPNWVKGHLGADFVAPTVAGMLFRDLPRALLGFAGDDRASLLEQAWEEPWNASQATLEAGLRASWVADPRTDEPLRPLLMLTGTSVEDGCRFVTSVLAASIQPRKRAADDDCLRLDAYGPEAPKSSPKSGFLPATSELADFVCPSSDVRMSTAALLSARFAFVSPSGRIAAGDCDEVAEDGVTYVVDGGYFDNSGGDNLLHLWGALEARVTTHNTTEDTCVVPVMVQLDNDPEVEPAPTPDRRPLELIVPPAVILGGIGSHESAARAQAAAVFDRPRALAGREVAVDGDRLSHFWVRLSPRAHPGPQPPLGWTLSETSFSDMRAELAADYNQPELELLAQLLSPDLSCDPPRGRPSSETDSSP
jgi:hypothetical protein